MTIRIRIYDRHGSAVKEYDAVAEAERVVAQYRAAGAAIVRERPGGEAEVVLPGDPLTEGDYAVLPQVSGGA